MSPELPAEAPVDVVMATFNSARDLEESLTALRRSVPVERLIVVDRHSTDGTAEIARRFGAEVHLEEVGLGYARTIGFREARTRNVLVLDSDVILRRPDFYPRAVELLDLPETAAVVGGTVGHPFVYGMPFGLTLLRTEWARSIAVPPEAQGFETYYFRRAIRHERRRVRYVPQAMEHRSRFRVRTWPEWQGAQLRLAAGADPYELAYAAVVSLLIQMNSRRPRNILYAPVFYLKILRGFASPRRWRYLDRRVVAPAL